MKKASYWEVRPCKTILCLLCPHNCKIKPGESGICRGRKNVAGELISLNYGEITSLAVDPIEKKPLYHFYPGSKILSVGTKGCNLACGFCQNWRISQSDPETYSITPEALAEATADYSKKGESFGISYTYSEPMVWFEFVFETAKFIHEKGLKNVLVTNGYINESPFRELSPYIDAINIDIKAFSSSFYEKVCLGGLEPVLRTACIAHEAGCHIEVTNLIIPGLNDSPKEIEELVDWVAVNLGDTTPLHFSRYYPAYKFEDPPTPIDTLHKAVNIGRSRLKYVYLGNTPGREGVDTVCYQCGKTVIKRGPVGVTQFLTHDNKCKYCGATIHIIQT
ncbi:MAG: AmmeMemoRadiSam system radical SAM enzyme [Firmicutes bacterium]|nr:AmmeMemoRadiSam system radical SAM enzyme [Bacillota bacterium]